MKFQQFGSRSSVVQKTFQPKSATSSVARAVSQCLPPKYQTLIFFLPWTKSSVPIHPQENNSRRTALSPRFSACYPICACHSRPLARRFRFRYCHCYRCNYRYRFRHRHRYRYCCRSFAITVTVTVYFSGIATVIVAVVVTVADTNTVPSRCCHTYCCRSRYLYRYRCR